MKRLRVSLLVIVLLALCGCQDGGMRKSADLLWPDLNDPYVQTTKKWTRHAELVEGIEVVAIGSATLKSREWREAFVDRNVELYSLTGEERSDLLSDQMRAHEDRIDVVVALSAPKAGVAELDFRGPMWRIFASRDNTRIYLSEIRPMEREEWPAEKLAAFFPYYKRWRKFYTLSFPRTGQGPLTLVISGPAGEMRFEWPNVDGENF